MPVLLSTVNARGCGSLVVNAIICPMQFLQRLRRLLRRDAPQRTSQAISQPIPQVTPDDVERVVCRDFQADEYTTVTAMLNEYGTEKWQREATRVRLAALKVANGSVE